MLQPTPLLRPSPMEISDVFSGTFAVLKARFGTFALITVVPVLILLGAVAGALVSVGAMLPDFASMPTGGSISAGPLAGYVVSLVIAAIIQPLISLKATAMMMVGTYETAQGQSPTVGSLWRSTKGFLWRILPLVLILALIVAVVYAIIVAVVVGTVSAAAFGHTSQVGGVVAAIFVVLLLAIPVVIFFGVKLLYVVPVIGIEEQRSFAGLKRAWSLTSGAFWRTFGYYLIATVLVQGVATVVSSLVQAGMVPALGGMPQPGTLAEAQAMFTVLLPAYVIAMAAQSLVQIIATPFQNSYLTVMYLDQARRCDVPVAAPAPTGWATPPPAPTPWGTQPPPPPPTTHSDGFGPGSQG